MLSNALVNVSNGRLEPELWPWFTPVSPFTILRMQTCLAFGVGFAAWGYIPSPPLPRDSQLQRAIPGSNDQMPAAIKPVGRAFPGHGGANPGAMRTLPARWCNCRFWHGRAFPGCAFSVVLPRSCVSWLRVSQLRDLECLTLGGSL